MAGALLATSVLPTSAVERILQKHKDFEVTWFNPGEILAVEKGEEILTLKMAIHKQEVNFYLTFPAQGGVRMYTDQSGMWEPSSLDKITYTEGSDSLTAKGSGEEAIEITKLSGNWHLAIYDESSKEVFTLNAEQIAFGYDDQNELSKVRLVGNVAEAESLYGLGERFNSIVQNGSKIGMWNYDGYDDLVSLTGDKTVGYKNIPLLHSSRGYLIFFNSSYYCDADIAATNENYYSLEFAGPKFDFFLWTGDALENIESYTDLTGKSYIPPKWAFSYLAGNAQQIWNANGEEPENYLPILQEYLENYNELGTPIGALYGELGVVQDEDAYKMMSENGTRVLAWQNAELTLDAMKKLLPGLKDEEYPVINSIKNPLMIQNGNYVDFTNPLAKDLYVNWYKDRISWGMRGMMVDFADNVYEDSSFSNGMTGSEMHNLYPYYYDKTVHEAFEKVLGSEDFLLFARAAAPGSQSYVGLFAGDHPVTYQGLQQVIKGGLNISSSGFSIWGSDIGGHAPVEMPTSDLFMRWMQFGAFSPLMRSHGLTTRGPWEYGELAEQTYQTHYWLRENLVDFIYGKALVSGDKGTPMMKSMALLYPDNKDLVALDDQYIFCDELLVAPVVKENSYYREVSFPEGTWTDFWTGEEIKGGSTRVVEAPQNYCPVYIKEGAMIPIKVSQTLELTETMLDVETTNAMIVTPGSEDRQLTHYVDETTKLSYFSSPQGEDTYRYEVSEEGSVPVVYAYGITASKVVVDGKELKELKGMPTDTNVEGYYVDYAQNRTVIRTATWQVLDITDSSNVLADYVDNAVVSDKNEKKAVAINGDIKTSWKANNKKAELEIDLGSVETINEVVLKWTNNAPQTYKVEASANGESWKEVYSTEQSLGTIEHLEIEEQDARYIRVSGIQKSEDAISAPELYDVSVYGDKVVSTKEVVSDEIVEEEEGTFDYNKAVIMIVVVATVLIVAVIAVAVFLLVKKKKGVE